MPATTQTGTVITPMSIEFLAPDGSLRPLAYSILRREADKQAALAGGTVTDDPPRLAREVSIGGVELPQEARQMVALVWTVERPVGTDIPA